MSMVRSRVRAALAAVALLGLCSTACDVKGFRVQVPGFDSAQVLGMWVWRASPQTGQYERYAQIEFGTPVESEGWEFLPYSVAIGGTLVNLTTVVSRDPSAPEDATLMLSFGSVTGTFKVSSYNAAGESELSEGTLIY